MKTDGLSSLLVTPGSHRSYEIDKTVLAFEGERENRERLMSALSTRSFKSSIALSLSPRLGSLESCYFLSEQFSLPLWFSEWLEELRFGDVGEPGSSIAEKIERIPVNKPFDELGREMSALRIERMASFIQGPGSKDLKMRAEKAASLTREGREVREAFEGFSFSSTTKMRRKAAVMSMMKGDLEHDGPATRYASIAIGDRPGIDELDRLEEALNKLGWA